jgi:hypothetical protein
VARSAIGWICPPKTHRYRNAGRLADRIFCPGCCRRNPLRNQPTNPSTTHQEHQCRSSCESLPPTRVAGHLRQDQTDTRSGGGSQIVFEAGDVRGIFEEVDLTSLAHVPLDGSESGRSGKMVKEPMFCEDRCSTRTRQQSKDPKHYERSLLSRNSLGLGGQKSDHERSPKRETAEVPRRSNPGRDHGIPQGIVHSGP